SRRRHTRFGCDWSSDVCSSDLDLPYVIASRQLVATPAEARRLNRPVAYIQANIHAGEVEGKEAMQALLRDLLFDKKKNVLDSIRSEERRVGKECRRRWTHAQIE